MTTTSTAGNNIFSEDEYQALLSHAELGVIHTSSVPLAAAHSKNLHDIVVKDIKAGEFLTKQQIDSLAELALAAKSAAEINSDKIITRQFVAIIRLLPKTATADTAVAPI